MLAVFVSPLSRTLGRSRKSKEDRPRACVNCNFWPTFWILTNGILWLWMKARKMKNISLCRFQSFYTTMARLLPLWALLFITEDIMATKLAQVRYEGKIVRVDNEGNVISVPLDFSITKNVFALFLMRYCCYWFLFQWQGNTAKQ